MNIAALLTPAHADNDVIRLTEENAFKPEQKKTGMFVSFMKAFGVHFVTPDEKATNQTVHNRIIEQLDAHFPNVHTTLTEHTKESDAFRNHFASHINAGADLTYGEMRKFFASRNIELTQEPNSEINNLTKKELPNTSSRLDFGIRRYWFPTPAETRKASRDAIINQLSTVLDTVTNFATG